jgi:methyl-accepting chemotaxis protein
MSLRNLKTAWKLVLLVALALAALGATAETGQRGLGRMTSLIETLCHRDVKAMVAFSQSQADFLRLRLVLRGMVAFADDPAWVEKGVLEAEQHEKLFNQHLDQGREALALDSERRDLDALKSTLALYWKTARLILDEAKAGRREGSREAAQAVIPTGKLLGEQLDKLIASKQGLADTMEKESRELQSAALLQMALVSLVAVLILLAAAAAIGRAITGPLGAAVTLLEKLAAGDLRERVVDAGTDEPALMSRALNGAMERMGNSLRVVQDNARQLAGAAEELQAVSLAVGHAAERTDQQAVTAASAAEEVSKTAQLTASGTQEMEASVHEIARHATESAKVSGEAAQTAQTAQVTMERLRSSSAEVGEVLKLINTIAARTSLLSLNATIEAARAGDAGKGFSVVATEVKELARQSADATEQIAQRVKAIQDDSGAAIEAFGSISGVIDRVNALQASIASAVEQQAATTQEMSKSVTETAGASGSIAQAVSGLAQEAKEAATGATQSKAAADALAQMSTALQGEVGRFQLGAA